MAVASEGEVDCVLSLPLAGLVSCKGLAEVAKNFADLRAAIDRIVDWRPPYLVFKACLGATLACNADRSSHGSIGGLAYRNGSIRNVSSGMSSPDVMPVPEAPKIQLRPALVRPMRLRNDDRES